MPNFFARDLPPFPTNIPSVQLETFTLADLDDPKEQDRLFETCRTRGFFYLEMDGLTEDAEAIARLAAEEAFQLPVDEKLRYPMRDSIFGYKRVGATRTDAVGTPDTAEFFNVAKDAMLQNDTKNALTPYPKLILDAKPLFARYMNTAHSAGVRILSILAAKLGLPPGTMEGYHRITQGSGDHVRLTHGPPRRTEDLPEIQTPGHTDFGTITILMNWLGGLQVWSDPSRGETGFENIVDPDARIKNGESNTGRWLWVVPPGPGKAIVNLGDAAVKFSGGVLCSGRHRVVPAPGEQGKLNRYSIVYFVRPEDDLVLKRLEAPGIPKGEDDGEQITAKEWIIRQSSALGNKIQRS